MIPRTVRVVGTTYRVLRPVTIRGECEGLHAPSRATIHVRADLAKEAALSIYAHEVTHAAIYESGIWDLLVADVGEARALELDELIARNVGPVLFAAGRAVRCR